MYNYFNNEKLSDCKLIIDDGTTKEELHVSKLILSSYSKYFETIFLNGMRETFQYAITVVVEPDCIPLFIDMIGVTYGLELRTSTDDILKLIVMADKYGFDDVIVKCCDVIAKEDIIIENLNSLLSLPDHIKKYTSIDVLIQRKLQFISNKYVKLHKIVLDPEFLLVPVEVLMMIIKSKTPIDSENTLFFAIVTWMFKDAARQQHAMELIKLVDFNRLSIYFLLDAVPHCAKAFTLEDDVRGLYCNALETYCNLDKKRRRLNASTGKSATYNNIKSSFNFVFEKISTWSVGTRYYIAEHYSNGYVFKYFLIVKLKKHVVASDENRQNMKMYTMYGYLNCCSAVVPDRFHLPTRITIKFNAVDDQWYNHTTHNSHILFEEAHINYSTNIFDCTWEDILFGKCGVIKNDMIKGSLTVEFLQD